MPKEYDAETLSRLQACELDILRDFVAVCDKNNIPYFGIAGTGIGALRHGGFIPWDDDIDLGVLYKDYPRLMELIKAEYPDKYDIVSAETYKDCPIMNTHIVLKGTKFREEGFGNLKFPQGIFLDIFLYFQVPADKELREKHSKKTWLWGKILILRHMAFPHLSFKGAKAKIAHIATAIIHLLLSIVFTHKRLYNKIIRLCTKYEGEDTGVYEWYFETKPCRNVYTEDDISPIRKIDFDGISLNFPNHLEKKLTDFYGDYMQLPPPEKRKNHCPDVIEFLR